MTKIYRSSDALVVERERRYFEMKHTISELLSMNLEEAQSIVQAANHEIIPLSSHWLTPVDPTQEIWACGVTYLRSKVGRMEESEIPDLYSKVYEAERPEIFYKTAGWRVVPNGGAVGIRNDSGWDVPEAEIVLVVNSSAEIFGYTIGNDMSSRSIEGENTLYLPQAKSYEKSCTLGSFIVPAWEIPDPTFPISLQVERSNEIVFFGESSSSQMKRTFPDLVSWLYRLLSMPYGVFILTGTGIVPDSNFTLHEGDLVTINAGVLGQLQNLVEVLP